MQLLIQPVQICQHFFLFPGKRAMGGEQGQEKLAKAQHQVTKWLFGCTLATFLQRFDQKPRRPKKPSIRHEQLVVAEN